MTWEMWFGALPARAKASGVKTRRFEKNVRFAGSLTDG
jgi:hypothetical protein